MGLQLKLSTEAPNCELFLLRVCEFGSFGVEAVVVMSGFGFRFSLSIWGRGFRDLLLHCTEAIGFGTMQQMAGTQGFLEERCPKPNKPHKT